ncbi:MAG: GNAT family N-acetyltransferase [Lutibacter sp.]|nr:MAG: GNAT family N-acetyltransferase [Lutibacter sp.]
MIFETERLFVRKLAFTDFESFHEMQSNKNVMRFVRAKVMTYDDNKKDLKDVIEKYDNPTNDFWIYAVERKSDSVFVGTIAFVKDKKDDEIGYRFLEKYWGNGYGTEIIQGMISYAKKIKFPSLIAYVSPDNIGSEKIIKGANFTFLESVLCEDLGIPENKYILEL